MGCSFGRREDVYKVCEPSPIPAVPGGSTSHPGSELRHLAGGSCSSTSSGGPKWVEFRSLKEGFDTLANNGGYFSVTNEQGVDRMAQFLGMDVAVVAKELKSIDHDENGMVSFAEFALWADKHTMGVPLGLQVPHKSEWRKGIPKHWTSLPAEEAAPVVPCRAAFIKADDKLRVEKADDICELAKWTMWEEMFALIEASPGCVNVRPEGRRFGVIHQAAFWGDPAVVRRLVESAADANLPARGGETALDVAKERSRMEVVEYLSSLGPAGGVRLAMAHPAIDAAKRGNWDELYKLLETKPDLINLRPEVREYGILHQAAFHGDVGVVRRLVEDFRADVWQLTRDGKTASQVAREREERTRQAADKASDNAADKAADNAADKVVDNEADNAADVSPTGEEEVAAAEAAAVARYLEACSPTIDLSDDFVSYPPQQFVLVEDSDLLSRFQGMFTITHKPKDNWTRDRKMASGFLDPKTPVPSEYQVFGAIRNEHAACWRTYAVCKEVTRQECAKPPMEGVPEWSPWEPQTMRAPAHWDDLDLDPKANEWLLLHGSTPEALEATARTGFNLAKVGSGGTTGGALYGDGTYFADSITKADEYARGRVAETYRFPEFRGCRAVAVCRVLGGRHYYTAADVQDCDKAKFQERIFEGHYGSTVGDRVKLKNTFMEYVVYNAAAVYLEYVVFYRRMYAVPVPDYHT